MKSSTKEHVEGKMHQVKCKIKKIAGKIVGNRDLEIEGKDENLAGKVQERIGEVKKVMKQ
ncbi:MAG: CsbD family protein [Desulfobacteraceae bacterium]|jgi:uncharacterized protein YjbJ (UPF0337 family)|nr:CsbD family protein [Desulfobacteraceae bacterium]